MRVEQLRDLKLSEDNCDALDVSYFDRTSAPARMQLLRKKMLKLVGLINLRLISGL